VLAAISDDLAEGAVEIPPVVAPVVAPVVKKIGLKLGGGSSIASKHKSTSSLLDSSGVFGGHDDSSTKVARAIIPLDYTGIFDALYIL
jgi:hypothetical protein